MKRTPTRFHPLIRLPAVALLLLACGACDKAPSPVAPQAITRGTVCSLDGMTLLDYPGPKAQIHLHGGAAHDRAM